MLKKMFKTILVLSVCIGVVIPTNAAVSVSDGSAFVTKAEFAADLNNLSNRMAQLENSLDAKIDSLVSSYLTRNGIWNGAKQQLASPNGLTITYGFTKGTSYTAKYRYNFAHNYQYYSDIRSSTMTSINTTPANATNRFIDNISKSGLLFVSTSLSNHISNDNRCYVSSVNRSDINGIAGDHFKFVYNLSFQFFINGVASTAISTSLVLGGSVMFLEVPALPSGTYSFFVSKGDVVTIKNTTEFVTDANTVFSCTLAWLNENGISTYDYTFDNVYVY